jgi:hypothetical protein
LLLLHIVADGIAVGCVQLVVCVAILIVLFGGREERPSWLIDLMDFLW